MIRDRHDLWRGGRAELATDTKYNATETSTAMRIGSALTLFAIGAILAFAVDINPTPVAGLTVRWDTVGYILMAVGIVGFFWALATMNAWRERNRPPMVEQPPVVERDTYIER